MFTISVKTSKDVQVYDYKSRAAAVAALPNIAALMVAQEETAQISVNGKAGALNVYLLRRGQLIEAGALVKVVKQRPSYGAMMKATRDYAGKTGKSIYTPIGDYTLPALVLYRLARLSKKIDWVNLVRSSGYPRKRANGVTQWITDGVDFDALDTRCTTLTDEAEALAALMGWTAICTGDPRGQGVKIVFAPSVNPNSVMFGDVNWQGGN
jgi:hypothetical protein